MASAFRAGDYIHVRTAYSENEAAKMVPGARWRPEESVWRYPLALTTCFVLRGVYQHRLDVEPSLADWAAGEMARWLTACKWLAHPQVLELPPFEDIGPSTLQDAVLRLEQCRDIFTEGDPGSIWLKPFQEVAATQLYLAEGAINASEMGTGKTPTAIVALRMLADRFADDEGPTPWPALVVCPNGLKRNWSRELDRWFPEAPHVVISGTAAKKRKAIQQILDGQAGIGIINYESLRSFSRLAPYGSVRLKRCTQCDPRGGDPDLKPTSCEVHERELNAARFATVIADEAHRTKDPKAKQTRALWAVAKHARFRWALTGTPIAATPIDLWALLHFVAPGEWPTRTGYADRWVQQSQDWFGGTEWGGLIPEREAELRQVLDGRMLRHTKAQVLPFLPPKVYEIRTCELRKEERAYYEAMKKTLIAEVDGGQLIAWNPLTKLTRLLQMASSAVEIHRTTDPETGEVIEQVEPCEPSSKLDALDDTLADIAEPAVVFFVSRRLLRLYEKRLADRGVNYVSVHGQVPEADRQTAVERFQNGDVDTILVTTAAGGEGLTLTRARVVVFVQRPWSLVQSKQAEDRVHRIGAEVHESITVIDIVAEDTAELEVRDALVEKDENLEQVVRDNLKRFLV